jgi:hypothetical protein
MRGAIPPLPQYVFMEWCLVKHGNYFTFYFHLRLGLVGLKTSVVTVSVGCPRKEPPTGVCSEYVKSSWLAHLIVPEAVATIRYRIFEVSVL